MKFVLWYPGLKPGRNPAYRTLFLVGMVSLFSFLRRFNLVIVGKRWDIRFRFLNDSMLEDQKSVFVIMVIRLVNVAEPSETHLDILSIDVMQFVCNHPHFDDFRILTSMQIG